MQRVTTLDRKPSLLSGSAQLIYITKVKTDMRDNTTSISILIVKSCNADQLVPLVRKCEIDFS